MRSADPRYPVGRTRLETVGVVACAVIMTIATIEVIQSAAMDLFDGFAKGLLCPLADVPTIPCCVTACCVVPAGVPVLLSPLCHLAGCNTVTHSA